MKHWIVNASPLILLGKIGRLDLIGVLVPSYSVPESVSREILAGPTNDPARRWIMADGGKSVVPDVKIPAEVLAWDLGDGGSAGSGGGVSLPGRGARVEAEKLKS